MPDATQWGTRDGYGGPGSFPKDVMGFRRPQSSGLYGRKFDLLTAEGRRHRYTFDDDGRLSATCLDGGRDLIAENVAYRAFEGSPGIFIVSHRYGNHPRLSTTVVIDLNRAQFVLVDQEIPAEGDADYRVRESRTGGYIGDPPGGGEVLAPPPPTDLVGRRFFVNYDGQYTYEIVFLTEGAVAWHCIRGNTGLVSTEPYSASQLAAGIVCLSWSEEAECLAVVMLLNFNDGKINGTMFGYDPGDRKILDFALGSEMLDSAEFGVRVRGLHDVPPDLVLQRNKDVVLRSHLEVWNRERYELIDELYDPEFACHFICQQESTGLEAMRRFVAGHRRSFPDWTERVVDIFAEGDRVVARYCSTGTHKGEFQGIAPTGRRVTVNEVSVYRVRNGRIIEQWGFPDGLSLVQQLTAHEGRLAQLAGKEDR